MLHSYPSPLRAQLRSGSRLAFATILAAGLGRFQTWLRPEGALSRPRWSSLKYCVGLVGALALSFVQLSAGVPDVPTSVVAVRGPGEAVVSFTAPVSDGGFTITSYTVTSSPGSVTATGSTSPITVTGLTNGTSYTFTVTATNAVGTGSASSASSAITPIAASLAGVNFGSTGGTVQLIATAVDTAGNIYLAGHFSGQTTLVLGGVTLTKIGTRDGWLAKLDASRTVIWAKNIGGGGADTFGRGIAVDTAGNVYFSGNFSANLSTPTLNLIGTQDGLILKFDRTGTITWAKNFGGPGSTSSVEGIAVDAAGNVCLAGYFSAPLMTPALTNVGTQDALALKLDSNGTITWAKGFGGFGASANGESMALDAAGNVYLNGNFTSANLSTPTLNLIGTQDGFALKLNSSGTTTWAKNFGGSGGSGASITARGLAVDTTGNVYFTGYFLTASLTTPTVTKIGTRDALAIKLDSSGNTTWAKNFGGSGASTTGRGITVDSTGNVYLSGFFNAASTTTPALALIGAQDAFALKLNSSGATTWAKNFGGSGASATATSLALDSVGNVYLGGYFQGSSLTVPALTLGASMDAMLIAAYLPEPSAPGAPTGVTATAGNAQATVSFTAPAHTGGIAHTGTVAITGYTVTSSPVGGTDSNAGSTGMSHVMTGLTNGTSYTFTVTATNSIGTGSASSASSAVTPLTAPTVTTPTSASIGTTSATLGGNVTSNGGASLTAVGVVYAATSTNNNPQLSGTGVTNLTGTAATGTFTVNATGLTPGTVYSYAAYATNSQGTTYSSVGTFTATVTPTPTLTFTTPTAATVVFGATLTNAATSTLSGGSYGTISYASSDVNKATVTTAGTVTALAAGTATITATQAAVYGVNTQATQTYTLTIAKATPTVTWPTPATITYGTALSTTQLNATSNVAAGTFSYSPASGTTLSAGTQTLTATFTPTDTTNYNTATGTVSLVVGKATPTLTWATPSAITYGTALSATQLNATSSLAAGTIAYSPASGATPSAGTQTLTATFTPTDTANYNTASGTVSLVVGKATPTLTWATPSAITYGTALSATQLNASGSVAGAIVYSPASGTTPSLGTQTLSATFSPTDASNYNSASAAVSLNVIVAVPSSPTLLGVTTANGEATLTFAAPSFTGGSTVTGYTIRATATDGTTITVNATGSPAKITGLTPGKSYRFTITANNSAGSSESSSTSDALTISQVNQTITFAALANRVSNSGSFALTATASSGLNVSYTVLSGPALLSGNSVDLTGALGPVVIRASQAGNATYAAASNVEASFLVTQGSTQAIFAKAIAPTTNAFVADVAVVLPANTRSGTLLMVSAGTPSLNGTVDFQIGAGGVFTATLQGAPVTYTITGLLTDNILSGIIAPLGLVFTATVPTTPVAVTSALGFYKSTALMEDTGATYAVVGANNEVLVLTQVPTLTTGGLTTMKPDNTYALTATGVTLIGSVNPTTKTATVTLLGRVNTTIDFSGLSTTTKRTDRLINLSSRAKVGTGESVLITGFVIGGTDSKKVLIRAAGPALSAFGLASTLPNPAIKIYQGSNLIAQNDDWNKDDAAEISRLGAFAFTAGSKDAALLTTLAPGSYTAQITDPSGTGTGVALAEIYDASINPNADFQRLVNISSRGRVTPDDGVLIGGFIVTGNHPKTLLIRGIGPALTNFGIAGALADPALTIYQDSKAIATNEGWANRATITTAAIQTGAFMLPAGSKDAAVVITLNPGAYTAQIKSAKNASSGVALIEIYEVP